MVKKILLKTILLKIWNFFFMFQFIDSSGEPASKITQNVNLNIISFDIKYFVN